MRLVVDVVVGRTGDTTEELAEEPEDGDERVVTSLLSDDEVKLEEGFSELLEELQA